MKNCIDKTHEPQELGRGNKPCIVALDKAGSLMLKVAHKKRIAHKKYVINGKEYIMRTLPSNYRHINGVNQLEVDTILLCENINLNINEWKIEDNINFNYNNENIHLIPDVKVNLSSKEKNILIFIEYDTGSEDHRYKDHFPTIFKKIQKYKRYKSSKIWESEFEYFPILLLVTEDDKRIPYFNKKCRELGLQGFGVYAENYQKFIEHLVNMS